MSINSQIQRIKNNILAAYSEIDSKGGTVPSSKTSANLVAAIMSISTGGGGKFIIISDSEAVKNKTKDVSITLNGISPAIQTVLARKEKVTTVSFSLENAVPQVETIDAYTDVASSVSSELSMCNTPVFTINAYVTRKED